MTHKLAVDWYKKLVSDIAGFYEGARRALVEAYWSIGKRIVEVEREGAIRAKYGDTLRVVVDLGFDTTTRQDIRLKGLDCPEMDTDEGKAAKRSVENAFRGLESITLKSVKPDQYDRYLGDVFFLDAKGQLE